MEKVIVEQAIAFREENNAPPCKYIEVYFMLCQFQFESIAIFFNLFRGGPDAVR